MGEDHLTERRTGAGDRRPPYNSDRRGATWLSHVKEVWPTYTAILLLLGTIAAFAGLPARVDGIEERQNEHDRLLRYMVCTMGASTRGYDPAACESYLNADLLSYLRPRAP